MIYLAQVPQPLHEVIIDISYFCITLTANAVCLDDGISDAIGTDRVEELYYAAIPLSGHLQIVRPGTIPMAYLDELLGDARGDEAAQVVISHFDQNNNGKLDKKELDRGFSKPPFEFGRVGRGIGVPILMSKYGSNGFINIHGAKRFVTEYGF